MISYGVKNESAAYVAKLYTVLSNYEQKFITFDIDF